MERFTFYAVRRNLWPSHLRSMWFIAYAYRICNDVEYDEKFVLNLKKLVPLTGKSVCKWFVTNISHTSLPIYNINLMDNSTCPIVPIFVSSSFNSIRFLLCVLILARLTCRPMWHLQKKLAHLCMRLCALARERERERESVWAKATDIASFRLMFVLTSQPAGWAGKQKLCTAMYAYGHTNATNMCKCRPHIDEHNLFCLHISVLFLLHHHFVMPSSVNLKNKRHFFHVCAKETFSHPQ